MLQNIIEAKKRLGESYLELQNIKIDMSPLNIQSSANAFLLLNQVMQILDKEIEELSKLDESK